MLRRSLVEKIKWLLLFGVIFASSMSIYELYPGIVKLSLLLLFSGLLLVISGGKIRRESLALLLVLTGLILLCLLVNGMDFSLDFGTVAGIITAFFLVSALEKKVFIEKYCSIMCFLAICSLIGYVLFLAAPGVIRLFPVYTWRGGKTQFANLILTVVPVSMRDYYRNFGIFYEPGIYQIFLNLALIFELFYRKRNAKRIAVIVITITTTVSTNGFISAAVIFLAYGIKLFFRSSADNGRNRKIVLVFLALAFLVGIIILYQRGIIDNRLFNKFTTTKNSGSTYDRLNAVTYAVNKFCMNPVFGVGHINLKDAYNITNTPLNWFMLYGLLFGTIANFLYCSFVLDLHEKTIVKMLLALALLSMIVSQNMAREWLMWCIVFYGLTSKRRARIRFSGGEGTV